MPGEALMMRHMAAIAGGIMASKIEKQTSIEVSGVRSATIEFHILGMSPLFMHKFAPSAGRELLLPAGRKTAADKAAKLKHDPIQEFRDSCYTDERAAAPTLLCALSSAMKRGIAEVAKDLPGATKAQVGRLCYVEDEFFPVWGVPRLHMTLVRMADMAHTPDMRTRAILPEWAATFRVRYTEPLLTAKAIAQLVASAGVIQGIGDWRPGKGAGSFGTFEIVSADDERYQRIVNAQGRDAQIAAMKAAEPYNNEAAELLGWYREEVTRRGQEALATME